MAVMLVNYAEAATLAYSKTTLRAPYPPDYRAEPACPMVLS
ncbi:MAG: hypothetical protein QGG02_08650 [Gammaproteobacteria bacterium]|nr:hypothetical protein [Gammaproteobacteria bacterium]